jgi:hypothetical protein
MNFGDGEVGDDRSQPSVHWIDISDLRANHEALAPTAMLAPERGRDGGFVEGLSDGSDRNPPDRWS